MFTLLIFIPLWQQGTNENTNGLLRHLGSNSVSHWPGQWPSGRIFCCSMSCSKVVVRVFRGAEYFYTLKLHDGTMLQCLMPSHHEFIVGEQVKVGTDIQNPVIFPE